ncbi:MAG: DUF5056 domain-containing protein [Bacteroidales bacterium]|nr:DUF5056 domain-containing protein [Bacteroidales bacterium]
MENNDDKILKDFLENYKSEIQDDGFSNRVQNQLPQKKTKTAWIVPVFTMLGFLVSILLIDLNEVISGLYYFILEVPLAYFIGGVMIIPIAFLPLFFYWERKWIY